MRKTDCGTCDRKGVPINDTFKIQGKLYCVKCIQIHFPDEIELKYKTDEKELDPTVCHYCNKDFGEVELNKIANLPICSECNIAIKNRNFPLWVKAFLSGIILLVIFSFVWNWKYYEGYQLIQQSNNYVDSGDFSNAALLMKSASKKVPEVPELEIYGNYFQGMDYLIKDKSSEALALLESCQDHVPADFNIENLITHAKIGVSFDNKDYVGFLEGSKKLLTIDSTSAMSFATVASAHACLYAEKGEFIEKENSLKFLNKAKKIDNTSKEMIEYYNIIEYRIDSKNIIKRDEFLKLFPNGWTKSI